MKKCRIRIELVWKGLNRDEPCFECNEISDDESKWIPDNEIHANDNNLFSFISFMVLSEDEMPVKHDLAKDYKERKEVAIYMAKLALVKEAEKRMGVKFGKLHLCKFQLEHGMR